MVCIYKFFLRPHTSGQGSVGPNDAHGDLSHEKTTPCSSHVPLLSTEQSATHFATPPSPILSTHASDRCTPDHAKEGVDAKPASIDIVEPQVQYKQHFLWTKSSFQ